MKRARDRDTDMVVESEFMVFGSMRRGSVNAALNDCQRWITDLFLSGARNYVAATRLSLPLKGQHRKWKVGIGETSYSFSVVQASLPALRLRTPYRRRPRLRKDRELRSASPASGTISRLYLTAGTEACRHATHNKSALSARRGVASSRSECPPRPPNTTTSCTANRFCVRSCAGNSDSRSPAPPRSSWHCLDFHC